MALAADNLNDALDSASLTPLHWRMWFLSALGIFLDGFDLFILAVAIPLITRDFALTPVWEGAISSAAVAGAFLGAFTLGAITDRFGRRTVFIVNLMTFLLFAALSALAWSPLSLLIWRFLLGAAVGADYPIAASYITEVMPRRLRNTMLVAAFSFQAIGMVAGAAIGLLVLAAQPDETAWRWMLGAGIVPALIVALFRRSLPESPHWLLAHGHQQQAADVCRLLTGNQLRHATVDSTTVEPPAARFGIGSLFSRRFLPITILTAAPWFLMDIATYGIGLFTPTIIAALAFSETKGDWIAADIASTEGTALLDLLLVVGFGLNILLIARLGPLRLQTVGFVGMAAGLAITAAASASGAVNLAFVFLGFVVFNLLMNLGPNATTYLLPAAAFPTPLRATGHGFAASAGKLGAVVGIFLLPIFRANAGVPTTLLVLAGACLLGLAITIALRSHAERAGVHPAHRSMPDAVA
ncbi:MAG: MFS transporter [Dehalococcoidia bacterium]|nr:MAG: MFS transporter [Dehalococcoidia bacterium]